MDKRVDSNGVSYRTACDNVSALPAIQTLKIQDQASVACVVQNALVWLLFSRRVQREWSMRLRVAIHLNTYIQDVACAS